MLGLRLRDQPAPATGLGLRDQPRLGYRPALDGMRAVSIVVVMCFHDLLIKGGYLGVNVFFVLSGFLITSLLTEEFSSSGRIAVGNFYIRRALRLLPCLFLVVAAVFIYDGFQPIPDAASRLWGDARAALLYFANWRAAFGHPAPLGYFTHAWSLSIEEQFYLSWPLILLVALRLRGRSLALALALVGAVAPALVRIVVWHGPASVVREYNGLGTRADALFVGCSLALILSLFRDRHRGRPEAVAGPLRGQGHALVQGHDRRVRRLWPVGLGALAWASLAFLGWAFGAMVYTSISLYYWGLAATAVASAVVIAHVVVSPRAMLARLLAIPPLVWVGRISYGLYLWHWPVFLVLNGSRLGWTSGPTMALRVTVSLTLATMSYWLWERPFLGLKVNFSGGGRLRVGARPAPTGVAAPAVVGTAAAAPAIAAPAIIGSAVLRTAERMRAS